MRGPTPRCGLVDWSSAVHGPLLCDVASALLYAGGAGRGRPLLDAYAAATGADAGDLLPRVRALLVLRWAVQADYFARRLVTGDLTGVDDVSANRRGLADARRARRRGRRRRPVSRWRPRRRRDEHPRVRSIDARLVADLVRDQLPRWAHLPVTPVARQGWDNRTFRLGDELSVRLPSAEGYVPAVAREALVLPHLAAHLPLPLPEVVATGGPGRGYPFPWTVRRWLPGATVDDAGDLDRARLADDLGRWLAALRGAPAGPGPLAGRHNHFRGCHPSVYGDEVQTTLGRLATCVDAGACRRVWDDATTSAWPHAPVWVHGDVAVGNLLVDEGRLSAVIDFGGCALGDPACDLVVAWTLFRTDEREVFRRAVDLPDDVWARARGWALCKALITAADGGGPGGADEALRVIGEVLADAA